MPHVSVCPMRLTYISVAGTCHNFEDMADSIFSQAAREANPPKELEHWAFVATGLDTEILRFDLEALMEQVRSRAVQMLKGWRTNGIGLPVCLHV